MRFKVFYDKTLKMSPEKLASQVGHVTLNLGYRSGYYEGYTNIQEFSPRDQTVIVLGLSHTKFESTLNALRQRSQHTGEPSYHVQTDLGLTEVEAGTTTAFGYIEL